MELAELNEIKETATKELRVAEQKQKELKKLSEQVEEEVNSRKGLIYNVERLIALKEGRIY